MSRVAFVVFDPIGPQLSGPAIRALGLARELARAGHETTVLTPAVEPAASEYPFAVRAFDPALLRGADVVVLPIDALARIPAINRCAASLVFDLYDPLVFELLASSASSGQVRAHCTAINRALRRGDFFLCASERQRDLWIGALLANGRLMPAPGADAEFRHLIDLVPSGIPERPPQAKAGARPFAIPADHTIIVSAGTMREWHDPFTPIRALAQLAQRRPDIHLLFLAGFASAGVAGAARSLAADLRVLDRAVHFAAERVPYAEWGSLLRRCDAGISTHRSGLDSRFSFRTRVLDYLWAGLPVLCTEGDEVAEFIYANELGAIVPENDIEALAQAMERVADDKPWIRACTARIAALCGQLEWRLAAKPLLRYCEAPHRAAREPGGAAALRANVSAAWRVFRTEGLRGLLRE